MGIIIRIVFRANPACGFGIPGCKAIWCFISSVLNYLSPSLNQEARVTLQKRIYGLIILFIALALACGGLGNQQRSNQAPPTKTSLPTFTPSPTLTLQPLLPTPTPVSEAMPSDTPTLVVVDTPTSASEALTDTPVIEAPTEEPTVTNTPVPPPPTNTPIPTDTPIPEPIIKYVLAGTNREFNCDFTYIYGTVKNANNFGIPDVEVRALGIHETTGQDFITRTDADGNYEIFRIPLDQLLAAQWAVMLMENGREVSERFHWASTPVCESEDLGHSQVLRIDWKLIE